MDPALLKKVLDAIAAGEDKSGLLAEIVASVAAEEAAEGAPPAEGAPMDAAAEPAASPPEDPNAPKPAANQADAPATAMLLRITGARTLADAEPILRSAITSARTIDSDRQALDMTARREVIVQMIEAGGETPATAWEGPVEQRKPVARLMTEPLESMRARVAALKARGGGNGDHMPPPAGGGGRTFTTSQGLITLTASEIKTCEESGAKPEAFAENKAIREAARTKGRK